jgi:acetyl esterase
MSLHPQVAALLERASRSPLPLYYEVPPAVARRLYRDSRAALTPDPPAVDSVQLRLAPGAAGPVPVRHYRPKGAAKDERLPALVYYHGGGWVIGGIDDFDTLGRQLAERTGCAVVLVDYRLAPEHRHPTAAEDAWAALRWVSGHVREIAGDAVPLIVAGDSAGGNLAAIVAQRARDEGGPYIALQVLVYPVTDCDLDTPSYLDPANQLMLTREAMIWFWDHYAPDQPSRERADASPLRAADLSGLPPAVILTAEHDPLLDEGEAYAQRLREAGVPVEHRRFAGQMHGFFTMVNVLPGSAAGIDHVVEALERHLAPLPA